MRWVPCQFGLSVLGQFPGLSTDDWSSAGEQWSCWGGETEIGVQGCWTGLNLTDRISRKRKIHRQQKQLKSAGGFCLGWQLGTEMTRTVRTTKKPTGKWLQSDWRLSRDFGHHAVPTDAGIVVQQEWTNLTEHLSLSCGTLERPCLKGSYPKSFLSIS